MAARRRRAERRSVKRAELRAAGVTKARDLAFPLSERSLVWDAEGAAERWRAYTKSTEAPGPNYWSGFFWRDAENPGAFDAFKLQFVDVVDEKPVAVWRAVTAAAGVLMGAHGGVDIPEADREAVKAKVDAYYAAAKAEFTDEKIVAPWRPGFEKASVERIAFLLSYAEEGNSRKSMEREALWMEALEKPTVAVWQTTANTSGTTAVTYNVTLLPEHQPGEQLPKTNRSPKAPEVDPNRVDNGEVHWEANLAPEGSLTDDGRMFAPGSITWRELPLSLMVMTETGEGHDGAWLGGRIDRIWRDGSQIRGEGVFTDTEEGRKAAKLVADGALTGVSVDIAVKEFEVSSSKELFNEEGELLWPPPEGQEAEEPNLLDILFGQEDQDTVFVVTAGVIGAATVCPFPAFADANISLSASGLLWTVRNQGGFTLVRTPAGRETASEDGDTALTAAAAGLAPVVPPVEWFENPELEELTPLQITGEGHVYGHAAAWDTCHIGFADVCTTAPHSTTGYELFHLGAVRTDTEVDVPVGKITLGTGHAPKHLNYQAAAAHYDDTGTVVADVTCGEDVFGIWVSGALRPDVSAERVRELRAAVLSGDWRSFDGNLELVALLAVNVPGFPIPRRKALVAAGDEGAEVLSLTAAGINAEVLLDELSTADLARFKRLAERAGGDDLRGKLARLLAAMGDCANCGHSASAHGMEKSAAGDSACTMPGCDCGSYEAPGKMGADPTQEKPAGKPKADKSKKKKPPMEHQPGYQAELARLAAQAKGEAH